MPTQNSNVENTTQETLDNQATQGNTQEAQETTQGAENEAQAT